MNILRILTFSLCFCTLAFSEDVKNYYFDEDGQYIMTTEAYREALPPPNALRVAPEFSNGFWPILDSSRNGWMLAEDHRGKKGWVGEDETEITELGPLPYGWSDEPPPTILTLEEEKVKKKAEIDANTTRIRDRDGLTYAGERFAMNDGAMLKWTGLMSAKDFLPYPVTILTIADKSFLIANQEELMQFLTAVLMYETAQESPLTTGRALRQRVEVAQTVDEVSAIIDNRK